MEFYEFLIVGTILILVFFVAFFYFLDIALQNFGEKICLMACREMKNSYSYKFDYSQLKCDCCQLIEGSLYCESVWKK
jgi:hypothetical protein